MGHPVFVHTAFTHSTVVVICVRLRRMRPGTSAHCAQSWVDEHEAPTFGVHVAEPSVDASVGLTAAVAALASLDDTEAAALASLDVTAGAAVAGESATGAAVPALGATFDPVLEQATTMADVSASAGTQRAASDSLCMSLHYHLIPRFVAAHLYRRSDADMTTHDSRGPNARLHSSA